MSLDAFSPPGDRAVLHAELNPAGEDALDPHLEAATGTLWVMGVGALLLAQAMPLVGGPGAATDPDFAGVPWVIGVALGAVAGSFVLIPGLLFLVAAVGVGRRTTWGWMLGVLSFGVMMAFCTPPIAMHGLYALLRSGVREQFE